MVDMVEGTWTIRKSNETVPHMVLVVCDDAACGYNLAWHGDLAVNEYYKYTDVYYDISDYYDLDSDVMSLIRDMFSIQWLDDADVEYHDFVPEDMESDFPRGGIRGDLLDWWEENYC